MPTKTAAKTAKRSVKKTATASNAPKPSAGKASAAKTRASKTARTASSRRPLGKAAKAPMQVNGMKTYALHAAESEGARTFAALKAERNAQPAFGLAATPVAQLDPETVAARCLKHAMASEQAPKMVAPEVDEVESQFRSLGTDVMPLTKTKIVKFRQELHKIPIYGSLVSVELDENNECLSINSSLGEPTGVDPIAKIAPEKALKVASKPAAYKTGTADDVPRLNYYFDSAANIWRLVYIIEDVPVTAKKASAELAPTLMDFVVDAHSGELVAQLPRTPTLDATAPDELGAIRGFRVAVVGGRKALRDETLNVETFDFNFRDPTTQAATRLLPGTLITEPFSPSAVSAHANASTVSKFLRDTLLRNNIDNQGGRMVSTIQALPAAPGNPTAATKQWFNAFWNGAQMVYGQVLNGGTLRSLAASLDVVGHEMFHGVTDKTSRLEYQTESGALNESYSDIFGTIISNFGVADIGAWNWQIGEKLSPTRVAFRDMKDPTLFGQPKHMRAFRRLPVGVRPDPDANDSGFVHGNSGIHNFAAFSVITAKGTNGRFLFSAAQCAAMFYIALTQQLSRRSGFSDSRRGVLLAARTLFRNDPPATRDAKVNGIGAGFSAAGIA